MIICICSIITTTIIFLGTHVSVGPLYRCLWVFICVQYVSAPSCRLLMVVWCVVMWAHVQTDCNSSSNDTTNADNHFIEWWIVIVVWCVVMWAHVQTDCAYKHCPRPFHKVCYRERQRDRETERLRVETEVERGKRERERQRDRGTEKQRDRGREGRERERERETAYALWHRVCWYQNYKKKSPGRHCWIVPLYLVCIVHIHLVHSKILTVTSGNSLQRRFILCGVCSERLSACCRSERERDKDKKKSL